MKNLEQYFMKAVEDFAPTFLDFPWENKNAYASWLKQQSTLVNHTTRYICLAAARYPLEDREGHYEWIAHLKAEVNHDLVARKDLEKLNPDHKNMPVYWSTEQIIQSQYYWLTTHHPSSLCGYALMLEGLACYHVPKVLEKLAKAHGANACQFLKLHADVDQDHFRDGMKFMAQIPADQQDAILKNLEQSTILYTFLLNEAAAGSSAKKKAA